MTIDPKEAEASLRDIAGAERRTRESLVYARAGSYLILWGFVTSAAYVATYASPRNGGAIWIGAILGGLACMAAINFFAKPDDGGRVWDMRLTLSLAAIIGYGLLWTQLLPGFGPRETNAFWPMLYMLGYAIAGIWLGRAFSFIGLAVTALVLLGYLRFGEFDTLWYALVEGTALIGGGLWLRRRG
jgi:hypothetical protein